MSNDGNMITGKSQKTTAANDGEFFHRTKIYVRDPLRAHQWYHFFVLKTSTIGARKDQ